MSGLPRDTTQTIVAMTVQVSRALAVRRSRMASRPQPAKAATADATKTAIAPMCMRPPCRASRVMPAAGPRIAHPASAAAAVTPTTASRLRPGTRIGRGSPARMARSGCGGVERSAMGCLQDWWVVGFTVLENGQPQRIASEDIAGP